MVSLLKRANGEAAYTALEAKRTAERAGQSAVLEALQGAASEAGVVSTKDSRAIHHSGEIPVVKVDVDDQSTEQPVDVERE